MTYRIIDAPQRSPEWFAARLGKATGSRAKDILATVKTKGLEAAARRDYRLELVCERLTGQLQEDGYVNAAMQRGVDLEPVALAAYEAATGEWVRQTGFLEHVELAAGCSLDGDVGECAGILEIKVPKSATHLRYVQGGGVPREHLPQVRHNLLVSGAAWCDFVSFDDRLPPALRLFVARITRDEADVPGYETALRAFLQEVDTEEQAIRTMADLRGQLTAAAEMS